MYPIGLIVGKFCPLHKGHENVIDTALANCQKLVIISYTSLPDAPTPAQRRVWLSVRFPAALIVVPELGFPKDEDDEYKHRQYCFDLCNKLGLLPDAIFGSENYLHGFAEQMSILSNKHVDAVIVDKKRLLFHISGTELRETPTLQSKWCAPIVSKPLGKRILFIGAESSGKTTISKLCGTLLKNSTWVPEFGREMWYRRNGNLRYEDMLDIGLTQVHNEERAMQEATYVFCDTSPLVTRFYSDELFGKVDPLLDILSQRSYAHVFWCERDFGYVEDGTRSGVEFGDRQEAFYKSKLNKHYVLYGSVEERLAKIMKVLFF